MEPYRKDLNNYCNSMSDGFFYMVNNMNIRHNNCNPKDPKNYNQKFASISEEDQEKMYDVIYEEGLALFVMMGHQERLPIINGFKNS